MLRLAFLWHQHQPSYRDPGTGRSVLPWVRLHATKDYYGMARLISEFSRIRATINLVPSLMEQLENYAENGAGDAWLEVMEPQVQTLTAEERERLVAIGFHANARTMIAAFPRYEELLRKKRARAAFADRDLLDLQVLATLSWFHRSLLESCPVLSALRRKGRDFTEEEKRAVFTRSREVAAEVLPLHRKLANDGRIEITTTPYYHPILPLLCDFRSAFEAMPWLASGLGFEPTSLRDDAAAQVERAVARYERVFGRKPRGMWPAEGSVSPDIVPIVVANGIQFIASDEEILSHSLSRPIRRDDQGNVLDSDVLYQPWRVRSGGSEVSIVFRDHRLSDLFGFDYHRDPEGGVRDFMRRLAWIDRHSTAEEPLVSIILDGENAWEHYPDGGVPFFRSLYRALEECDWVETVTLGEELARRPPGKTLPKLFSGSWIDHNFAIWIGHEEDRKAWRLLIAARAALCEEETLGRLSDVDRRAAWESIYAAEGSDWYWWYGDDRSSGMDEIFDHLFREHLTNVYRRIGREPPGELEFPIGATHDPRVQQPTAFLDVRVDGRRTSFFEWLGAGRFRADDEAGAMSRTQAGAVEEIAFGFDAARFFLALDFGGHGSKIFHDGGSVHVRFLQPKEQELTILGPGRMLLGTRELSSIAVEEILEAAIPWADLGAGPGSELRFYVEVKRSGGSTERFPRGFAIRVEVPDKDFELRSWAV